MENQYHVVFFQTGEHKQMDSEEKSPLSFFWHLPRLNFNICIFFFFFREQLYITESVIYHIYQPLRSGRIWHKVNFLSRV